MKSKIIAISKIKSNIKITSLGNIYPFEDTIPINEFFSYNSFENKSFIDYEPDLFNNSIIYGSNFSQKNHRTIIFPENITELYMLRCNLDNVYIRPGIKIYECSNKQIKLMNDLEYWELNEEGLPIEPRDKNEFEKLHISIYPKDIPKEKMNMPITYLKNRKRIEKEKISNLRKDEARLKQILIDSGELPKEEING
jgi:hypothetical protein